MARLVQIRSELIESLRAGGTSKRELAGRLGISEGTLSSLLDDSWGVIDRRLLERLIDELNCQPGDLFSTMESPFFDVLRSVDQFEGRHRCHLVVPPNPAHVQSRDHQAVELIEDFLRDKVSEVTAFLDEDEAAVGLDQLLEDGSCVILGGPRANRLCGHAVCSVFGLDLSASIDPGARFWFVDRRAEKNSPVLSASPVAGFGPEPGIYAARENQMFGAHDFKGEEGLDVELRDVKDAAVILVHNHGLSSGRKRKLIVLAGFSRIGTLAAAQALIADYRDLEPLADQAVTWGIIEARYNKPKGTTRRSLKGFKWMLRVGGRNPIKPGLPRKSVQPADGGAQFINAEAEKP